NFGCYLRFITDLATNRLETYHGSEGVGLALVDQNDCGWELFIDRSRGNIRSAPLILAVRYIHYGQPQRRNLVAADFIEETYAENEEVVFAIEFVNDRVRFWASTPGTARQLLHSTAGNRGTASISKVRVIAGGYRKAELKTQFLGCQVYLLE
ncbi:MAG: hypothetical protein AAF623_16555, partial [Planctomycetota bacterium]